MPPTLPATDSASTAGQINTPPSIGFQARFLDDCGIVFGESPVTHKSAIVTGATSGLGRATALRLARDGFQILAVGRDADALASVAADITAAGGTAASWAADVTSADAPRQIVEAARAAHGGIDALVNAAGIIASGSVMETSDDDWDTMMNINVRGPFRLLRHAAPALIARRGAVVNVSSVAGLRAFPGIASYAV
jgi:NAD(P)-dependent dehydrogenase (short-subunit alcohol dehydrogenase family)